MMVEPTILPRSAHTISRRDIDPAALKVLYKLHEHNYVAYLVGGSVRDLLLNRRPKDFDIGTSAHPHQIKKLFRNCWIIGRRFRLAHVKFGPKTIEVATFRRQVEPGQLTVETETTAPGPEDILAPADTLPAENTTEIADQDTVVRPSCSPRDCSFRLTSRSWTPSVPIVMRSLAALQHDCSKSITRSSARAMPSKPCANFAPRA
jgi:hypothetical protein